MLSLLINKELREIVGSTKFALTFGVTAVLVLLAFYVGARNYQVSYAQYEAAVAQNQKEMEGLTVRRIFELRPRAILPPQPLAALVSGVSNDIGRSTVVFGRGMLKPQDSRYNDDPIYAVFRFLDLEFIFQVVLSLLAIMIAYDAINGEKESGTLRLALSNAVPRGTYVLGKYLGYLIALAIPLIIPLLLGCLVLIVLGIPMDGSDWFRLFMVVLSGLFYLSFFLALSMLVSAATHRTSESFLFLLAAWVLLVFVWPRASVLLTGRAVEVTPLDRVYQQTTQLERQLIEEDMKTVEALMASGESQPGSPDFASTFMKKNNALVDERDKKVRALAEKLNEQRTNELANQRRLAYNLARLSPASAFSLSVTDLTGTSLELKEAYQEALLAYQQDVDRFVRNKSGGMSTGSTISIVIRSRGEEEKDDPIDVREVPVFTYTPPGLSAALQSAMPDLGLLILSSLVTFGAAFVLFLRYDLR